MAIGNFNEEEGCARAERCPIAMAIGNFNGERPFARA
jgi:hypothetical protein